MLKLNIHAKTTRGIKILHQAKNQKFWLDKTAAVLEAKSDEKEVAGQKPVVGRKERRLLALWCRRDLWWDKRAVATKKPTAEMKPAEKKPTTEEKIMA